MRILLIGAPGSGKTTIAKNISKALRMKHIECDVFFNEGFDLRSRVEEEIKDDSWVIEGHLSKIHDLVLPLVDKVVVIEDLRLRSLFRALKRDWMKPQRLWFNIQYYDRMNRKREEIINELPLNRKKDVLFLNNFPNLSESKLVAFSKKLKTKS